MTEPLSFKSLLKKLWPYLLGQKQRLKICVLLVLLFVVVGRALPFLFGRAIDVGLQSQNVDFIWPLAFMYFAFEGLRLVLAFLQNRAIQNYGNQVLFDVRKVLIRHVLRLPITYFNKNTSGRIVTRLTTDVFALGDLFSQGFAAIAVACVEMISIFVSLMWVSLPMTGLVLLTVPPMLYICMRLSAKIRIGFAATKSKLAAINSFSAESFSGIKTLQLYSQEEATTETFDVLSTDYRNLQLRTVRLFATMWPILEAFHISTLALAIGLGAYFHENGELSLGELAAFILLLQGFFKPLKTILERYNQLQNSLASADRVFQLLSEPLDKQYLIEDRLQPQLEAAMEFRNVHFRYGDDQPEVLKGVSFSLPSGQKTGLIGRTGAGKSTVMNLLQGFYLPSQGEVKVFGHATHLWNGSLLREHMGVVGQDAGLFAGTLYANVTMLNLDVSREQAKQALINAQAEHLLHREGGIDTIVTERGSNFSAGERQLIAIARVFAANPNFILLDEATANVDQQLEAKIRKATDSVLKNRTALIIAHRLSTLTTCDQIILLDAGQVVKTGPPQTMLSDLSSESFTPTV